MSLETLSKAMSNFGISAHQATKAVEELAAHIPPFTEDDILRIKINPSLSMVDKIKIMSNFGISAHQATKAVEELAAHIPPFTEDDILRIKINPSLSMVDKIKIIKNIRKQMKKEND